MQVRGGVPWSIPHTDRYVFLLYWKHFFGRCRNYSNTYRTPVRSTRKLFSLTLQSLSQALTNVATVDSARQLALEHDVNLKTVIKYLEKAEFVYDNVNWIKIRGLHETGPTDPKLKPLPPVSLATPKAAVSPFDGIVLLIPKNLIARAKEIVKYRRDNGIPSSLEELQQEHDLDDATTQKLALNWLLDQVDQLKLSWLEHNVLTANGFQPISRKLPPLPEVPKAVTVEPYEPHEPDDAEPHEPHEPGY